jgi:phytoene desaturase
LKSVSIIGGGIAGLTSASLLASKGFDVTLIEKNDHIGGRIRTQEITGYHFDMGPSWYWMPEVFEKFYNQFGHTARDFYELKKLDPGFKVFYKNEAPICIPSDKKALYILFENIEEGSSIQLEKFLQEAEEKYEISMSKFVYNPSFSWMEYISMDILKSFFKHSLLKPLSSHVAAHFKDKRLRMLMEFPVLFLGAKPKNIPALYSIMNHSALTQGTFYPMGGMVKIAEAFEKIALELGVKIIKNTSIEKVDIENKKIKSISSKDKTIECDTLICAMDYHHFEQNILEKSGRKYDEKYWDSRTLSPSSLIFFLGIEERIEGLEHHNLFFDADFKLHAEEIYDRPQWPSDPLFYICCPSKTDASVAPEGCENIFILMPLAPGIEDTEVLRTVYFDKMMKRLRENNILIKENMIKVKESYCIKNFEEDYNSYKGNAYGLANTLSQTGVWKPSIKSNKIDNLYYAGQLTVPGPGLPPSIISGEIVASVIIQNHKTVFEIP